MRRIGLLAFFAALLAAAPFAASAQGRAYVLNGTAVFAGPGADYPVVAQLGPGVGLGINGCLNDYSWCDVTFGANRGWVYAGELGYPYQSRRVPVLEYGPRLALPVITFSLGSYWDRYYRGRPWYGQRSDWARRYPSGYHGQYHQDWRTRDNNNWHGNNYNNNHNNNNHNNNNNNQGHANANRAPEVRNHAEPAPRFNNEVRRNEQPHNSQAETFKRDVRAGRDPTHANAPRPQDLPRGSTTAPTDNGAGHQQ
jgi:uncharacterized protein YraI